MDRNPGRGGVCWFALSVALGIFLFLYPPIILQKAEREFFDLKLRFASISPPREKLALVLGGERSVRELQRWPWPRAFHGKLLDRLSPAKVVMLDILFNEPSDAGNDAALVNAVRRHGRVIGSAYVIPGAGGNAVLPPFPSLSAALLASGAVNMTRDVDSVYRQGLWGVELKSGDLYPSLALAALLEVRGRGESGLSPGRRERSADLPWKKPFLERNEKGYLTFWIHHPAEGEIPVYEYVDVLEGRVPPENFKDAVVLVGISAAGVNDAVPISFHRTISGAQYIMNSLYTLLSGFSPKFAGTGLGVLLSAAMAFFASLLGFMRPRAGVPAMVALCFGWALVSFSAFPRQYLYLPTVHLLAVCFFSYVGALVIHMWRVHRRLNVQLLPIDSLLVLSTQDEPLSPSGFSGYMRRMWADVERKTGVALAVPRADESSPPVSRCLERIRQDGATQDERGLSGDPIVLRNLADEAPHHRMLLKLPFFGKGKKSEYAVLAWDGARDSDLLKGLAALVLSSATHYFVLEQSEEQKRFFFNTIKAMAGAIDAKDPVTAGHSERVAELSRQIAEWLGLSPQEVENIYFAAVIHDIGKIGVADDVLNKPGRLSEDEYLQMKAHPIIGALVMEPVELEKSILDGILEHHERIDGRGYPGNVKGDGISLSGRIIKIADVYDALASKRQYKEPWPLEDVYDYLWAKRGTEFDARIVDVFIENTAPPGWTPHTAAAR